MEKIFVTHDDCGQCEGPICIVCRKSCPSIIMQCCGAATHIHCTIDWNYPVSKEKYCINRHACVLPSKHATKSTDSINGASQHSATCMICLQSTASSSMICCGSFVHSTCMAQWLAAGSRERVGSCPYCTNHLVEPRSNILDSIVKALKQSVRAEGTGNIIDVNERVGGRLGGAIESHIEDGKECGPTGTGNWGFP